MHGCLVLISGVKCFGGIVSVRFDLVIVGTERIARDAGEEIAAWDYRVIDHWAGTERPINGVKADKFFEQAMDDLSVVIFRVAHMLCDDHF